MRDPTAAAPLEASMPKGLRKNTPKVAAIPAAAIPVAAIPAAAIPAAAIPAAAIPAAATPAAAIPADIAAKQAAENLISDAGFEGFVTVRQRRIRPPINETAYNGFRPGGAEG